MKVGKYVMIFIKKKKKKGTLTILNDSSSMIQIQNQVYTKIYIQYLCSEQAHSEIQHCTIKLPNNNNIQTCFPQERPDSFGWDKHFFLDMPL